MNFGFSGPLLRLSSWSGERRIVVSLFVVAIVAVLAWDAISVRRIRSEATNDVNEHVSEELGEAIFGLEKLISNAGGDLLTIANTPPVPAIQRASVNGGYDVVTGDSLETWSNRFTTTMRAMIDSKGYQRIRMFDAHGVPLISVQGDVAGAGPIGAELTEFWADAYSSPKSPTWVGLVHLTIFQRATDSLGIEEANVTLGVWTPVFDVLGNPAGMLLLETDARGLMDNLADQSDGTSFLLVAPDGDVIATQSGVAVAEERSQHALVAAEGVTKGLSTVQQAAETIAFETVELDQYQTLAPWLLVATTITPSTPSRPIFELVGRSLLMLVATGAMGYWLLSLVERARATEERYRALVELSPDGIMLQSGGEVVYANGTAAELLEAPGPRVLLGLDVASFVHPDSEERIAELLDPDHSANEGLVELDVVRFDGERRTVEGASTATTFGDQPAIQVVLRDVTERKRVERELNFAQTWQSRTLAAAAESIVSVDSARRIVLFNKAAEELFGYPAEEAIGSLAETLIPAQFRTEYQADLQRIADAETEHSTGDEAAREIPILRKDGGVVPTQASVSRVGSGNNQVITIIMRDISEQREAERAISASRERLRMVLGNVPVAVTAYDVDGHVTFRGGAGTELLEERVEIAGPAMEASPEEYPYLCLALAGQRARVAKREGDRRLEVYFEPVVSPDGVVTGVVSVASDVTELTDVQDALQEKSRQTEHLLGAISSVLISVKQDGTVILWNRAAEETLGVDRTVAVGLDFASIPVTWEQQPELLEAVRGCLADGEKRRLDRFAYQDQRSDRRFLVVSVTAVTDSDGERTGALISATDITDRLVLEGQLTQVQKLESIGQLAAGIAHEINTPTQFVGDNIRFLRDAFSDLQLLHDSHARLLQAAEARDVPADLVTQAREAVEQSDIEYLGEEIPNAIEQTLEGVERVATIVRAMKEFSHPGSGTKELTDLNQALESTATVARNEWKYIADLQLELSPDLPPVPCLAGELNQAFLNIIINAAHAIEESTGGLSKGVIKVSSALSGDWAEVRISDNGSGIPSEVLGKIFDPFFTTKTVGRGTGQGLSIARSVIADKHDGTLTVESRSGQGTTFVIRLPLHEDAAAAA